MYLPLLFANLGVVIFTHFVFNLDDISKPSGQVADTEPSQTPNDHVEINRPPDLDVLISNKEIQESVAQKYCWDFCYEKFKRSSLPDAEGSDSDIIIKSDSYGGISRKELRKLSSDSSHVQRIGQCVDGCRPSMMSSMKEFVKRSQVVEEI